MKNILFIIVLFLIASSPLQSQTTYYTVCDIDTLSYVVTNGKLLLLKRDELNHLYFEKQIPIPNHAYVSSAISGDWMLIASVDSVFLFNISNKMDPIPISAKYVGNVKRVEKFGDKFIVVRGSVGQIVVGIDADSLKTFATIDKPCGNATSYGRMCQPLSFSYPYVFYLISSIQQIEMWKYDALSGTFILLHTKSYPFGQDWKLGYIASNQSHLFIFGYKLNFNPPHNYWCSIQKRSIQNDSLTYIGSLGSPSVPIPVIYDWEISSKFHREGSTIFKSNTTGYYSQSAYKMNISLGVPYPIITDHHVYRVGNVLFYSYKITDDSLLFKQFTLPTSVEEELPQVNQFRLSQNYPNPFNPSTKIKYEIPNVISTEGRNLNVTLKVYDVLGNLVATLVNEEKPTGNYEIEFSPSSINHHTSSGIYFYQLKAGNFTETKKMILLK